MPTDSESASVLLGDRNGAHLLLRPLHRDSPGADGPYDANWLITDVRVKAGGFTGAFRANLRVEELESFHAQLADLYARLDGAAVFESSESWLHLVVRGDGRGGLVVRGEATDDPAIGNRLAFVLLLDQSYLPDVLRSLETILAAYPLVGR